MRRDRRRVEWAEVARRDLLAIADYLLEKSPENAERVISRIEKKASTLSSFQSRGRVLPELARLQIREYRELQAPPYRLVYRVEAARILVLGIFDSRRNLEDILLERLLFGA